MKQVLLGGESYNDRTLSRFFILHGAVLPVTLILVLMMHIGLVRLHGVTELKFEDEAQGPAAQFNFFPEHFYTELIIGLTLMILLSALATLLPVEMGPRANPLITPEVIKPEWFFYVAFRWLKLFSGTTAVLTQGLIVFVMFCWPFIDDWLVRRFKYADISVWIGVVGALDHHGLHACGKRSSRIEDDRYDARSETLGHRRAGPAVPAVAGRGAVARGRHAGSAEAGHAAARGATPAASRQCVDCHTQVPPASSITGRARPTPRRASAASTATRPRRRTPTSSATTAQQIATIVTPRDCARCHPTESAEFAQSHHSKAGNILASLDNFLAETVEGSRVAVQPAFADARQSGHGRQRHGPGQFGLPAVPWVAGRVPGERWRPGDHARPEARRARPADQSRRGRAAS